MSIEAWTQFVVEFQQYLAVFDTPTRYFIYTVTIGLTILSLTFAYYMTKLSLDFGINVLKESFNLMKSLFELMNSSVKGILQKQPDELHTNSENSMIEAPINA